MALVYDEKSGHLKGTVKSPFDDAPLQIDNDLNCFTEKDLSALQVEVYVMCGGGMLGKFAATQPSDFYIDARVGRLPFSRRDICQAVEVLKGVAIKLGKDPHSLPKPHICGVWVF